VAVMLAASVAPAVAGVAALLAAAYIAGVLPRLKTRRATAALGLLATVLCVLLGAVLGAWALLPWVTLAAGHLGWFVGSRRARVVVAHAGVDVALTTAPAPRLVPQEPTEHAERTRLGRYLIDRPIGRGAMGAVYLAHDPQIGRQVAVKTMALGREFAGAELAEARVRFFREAEMAGRLQHRDIVTIFDAGEEDGLAYIAMEFVKGHDLLPHTVAPRLLPLPVVLRTAARVADALAYAHSQGVVHRDIKPANVMLDDASGSVKVTDFGIARVADASRTRTGRLLGTPSFMAPEQMAGGQVDGRADLYSLGVMLFQLVTGALPHASDSMAELMYRIANETAPDVRTLRPELPAALARLIASALEKRPDLRPADGASMATELRAALDALRGEPAGPRDAGPVGAPRLGTFDTTVAFSPTDPRHNSES
jgi:eukaryotic-like serine/threonine-protein kinase